ncbi:MAG: MFS transporter [Alphaproteobacteria bacterium]|nr:MFS transporter [Alphaproteobacteria bacterium]MCB9696781.1 MFS transporter [Alphaproteobacteria bacterium]
MYLLFTRRFGPMFWTQLLGAFNDNLFKQSLVYWIAFEHLDVFGFDHKTMVMLSAAIFILPFFLFSATSGQLADKLDKATVIRFTKNLEIVAMLAGSVGFWLGQPEVVTLVLFVMGIQSTIFGPCKYGILPQHLPPEELVTGNALVETATNLAILGGSITAGLVFHQLGIVAGGVITVAVLGRIAAQFILPAPSSAPDLPVQWDPVRPTWDLIRLARSNRPIWLSILGISWFWMFGAAFLGLFPDYTENVLGANEHVATLFLALFSIGIGVGSLFAGQLSHHRVELGIVPIGSLGMTLFTADLALVGTPWAHGSELIGVMEFLSRFQGIRISFDLVMLAISGGLLTVPLYALVQQRAKEDERARIIAANNVVNSFWTVVGALVLAGVTAYGASTPMVFALLAVVTLAVSAYMYWVVREFALRFVTWILSNLAYRVKVDGTEHIPSTGPALIVANHVSFIDWFVLLGALAEPPRVVMDKDIHSWPVLGFLFRQANTIPIASAKKDPDALEKAMDEIHQALAEGWTVVIFPEGKLTGDGDMHDFRPGMERILARDPVPVVPVAINGLWGSFFSRKDGPAMTKPFTRGTFSPVRLTFGPHVPAEQATAQHMEEVVRQMWSRHPESP